MTNKIELTTEQIQAILDLRMVICLADQQLLEEYRWGDLTFIKIQSEVQDCRNSIESALLPQEVKKLLDFTVDSVVKFYQEQITSEV